MFLLPCIMEYQGPSNARPIEKNKDNYKKTPILTEMNIKDYIYIENEGEILRLKVTFDHMDIVNILEYYISNTQVHDFSIMSKDKIYKEYNISSKFFPYLGKYRLENNYKKTDNYYVPEKTELFKILIDLYNKSVVTIDNLCKLVECYSNEVVLETSRNLNIINELISCLQIELEDKYSLEEINTSINFVEKFSNEIGLAMSLSKIKWILESSKKNKEYIRVLGIENKFIKAINSNNKKVK